MSEPLPEGASPAPNPNPGSGEMFDQIAGRYDLLNRLMSMGIDQSWRRKTVAAMELPARAQVLDLATGTADLAMMIARIHPDAKVVGSDPSARMLEVGVEKIERAGLTPEQSYRVTTRRADKSFPHISPEVNRLIGSAVGAGACARGHSRKQSNAAIQSTSTRPATSGSSCRCCTGTTTSASTAVGTSAADCPVTGTPPTSTNPR